MIRTNLRSRLFAVLTVMMSIPVLSVANAQGSRTQSKGGPQQAQQSKSPAPLSTEMDVEELNDNLSRHVGKKVVVTGEIEEWLDNRTFVLESGGLFNDEIAVVVPPNTQGLDTQRLTEDANIVVSGTLRQVPVVELERELSWDFDPELEMEFEGVKSFLVADRITRQRD